MYSCEKGDGILFEMIWKHVTLKKEHFTRDVCRTSMVYYACKGGNTTILEEVVNYLNSLPEKRRFAISDSAHHESYVHGNCYDINGKVNGESPLMNAFFPLPLSSFFASPDLWPPLYAFHRHHKSGEGRETGP